MATQIAAPMQPELERQVHAMVDEYLARYMADTGVRLWKPRQ